MCDIAKLTNRIDSPKLHFVKVDVKSAFDSIDLDKLFNVLKKIFNTVGSWERGMFD